MISHLIYWHEKFNDMDRWIKISYQEWYDQCRLTERKLKNSLKNLKTMGFVEIKIKRFNCAPCLHFKVDFNLLSDALNKYIENDDRNGRNVQIRNGRNVQINESDETSESITENYTKQSEENPGGACATPPALELGALFKKYEIVSPKKLSRKDMLLIEDASSLLEINHQTLHGYLDYLSKYCAKWLYTGYMVDGKKRENDFYVILRLSVVTKAIEGEFEDKNHVS